MNGRVRHSQGGLSAGGHSHQHDDVCGDSLDFGLRLLAHNWRRLARLFSRPQGFHERAYPDELYGGDRIRRGKAKRTQCAFAEVA